MIKFTVTTKHLLLLYFFCVSDVPDAPQNVKISELKTERNVSLSWVPGSDHNSSVTGIECGIKPKLCLLLNFYDSFGKWWCKILQQKNC